MKRKLVVILSSLCVVSGLLVAYKVNDKDHSEIFATEIESLAGPEGCTVLPGQHLGVCRKNVNGLEYNCVEASFFQHKDCTSD